VRILGDLTREFNFDQAPRKPMILPVHPKTTLTKTVPFHPVRPRAAAGKNRAKLSWTFPKRLGADGGLPLEGFVVRVFENGRASRTLRVGPTKSTAVVTGLRRGSTYRFKIAGINRKGVGYYSAPTKPVRIS
jgi:fibronectin type III domain protein